jgi:molecular chaperone HscB
MDPFATLGVPRRYHVDKDALDRRYRELQQALHPDRHASAPASERAVTLHKAIEVNEAYRVLRDDQKRGEALLAALGGSISDQSADPELLMEMMELREALSEARAERDAAQVARLAASVSEHAARARAELAQVFDVLQGEPGAGSTALERAQALLGRLRYYRRFQDEVAQFEDEALA